ncbi:MAG: dihydrofolate reductase [Pseudomonadota bacterium]
MKPRIVMVVAVARNGVIGVGGTLPWHVPSDLKTFRALTVGKPVIMGRKTFEAIGRPLPKRTNIVVTRDPSFAADGIETAASLDEAIARATELVSDQADDGRENALPEIAIIGGAQIYAAALPKADRVYLTKIDAAPEGDAHFAPLDPGTWQVTERRPIARDPKDEHAALLIVYDRHAGPGVAPAASA